MTDDMKDALDTYIVVPFTIGGVQLSTFWMGQAKSYQQACVMAVWVHRWPAGTKLASRLSQGQLHGRRVDTTAIVHSEVPADLTNFHGQ
jgi:hypothetical protein